jgi:hypothetical protein
MTTDPTAATRKSMLPGMPHLLRMAIENGEQVWDTTEMRRDFDVTGFLAPFVVVRRKDDGAVGTLEFAHTPRYYWGFTPDQDQT